ncbi:hypothetical protein M0R45_011126 [Rubus argutus]|uniref:Uncharacterized protein n=1 Tax=Rubus argutus TaxID=59490 RepID=A0AAW1Y943_RUBAR
MKGPLERLHLRESHQSSFPNPNNLQTHLDSRAFWTPDAILSQDFFCTPDYITPENQNTFNGFDCTKENIPCPKSPEKTTVKSKRRRQGQYVISSDPLSPTLFGNQELGKDCNWNR